MPGAPAPSRLAVPRWVQLVGLPLLLLLAWAVAGAVRHAVFVFLVALLIALLLNPLASSPEQRVADVATLSRLTRSS